MICDILINVKIETIETHENLMKNNSEYRAAYLRYIEIAKRYFDFYKKLNLEK